LAAELANLQSGSKAVVIAPQSPAGSTIFASISGGFGPCTADFLPWPVEGTVDQKSQRAAWRFSDEKDEEIVFETGIYNLTKDETKCLVHFGADNTHTWTMIRLPAPEEEANE